MAAAPTTACGRFLGSCRASTLGH